MSSFTSPSSTSRGQLFCPLLQTMRNHSLNSTHSDMVVVWIHGLVSCLGILENALILWVVGFRLRRRTVASVWVLNLAMSDFLATLTLPLFTHYLHSSHSWELGGPLCSAQASIFFLNMFVSAFLLAAISLDRCLLVAKPVWTQNHRSVSTAHKVCALGWLWAAINTFPYFLFRSVTEKLDGRKLCYHHFALYSSSEATLERDCEVRQVATAISKLLLAFLAPLVVSVGSYIIFGLSLRNRSRKRKQSASRITGPLLATNTNGASRTTITPKTIKTKNILLKPLASTRTLPLTPTSSFPSTSSNQTKLSQSFTKMVTSVIAAFALCWAPYHIFCLIEVAAQYWPGYLPQVEKGLPIATTFAFLNPVLNPILYAFSCPNFCVRIRQSLGALFEGLVEEGEGGMTLVQKKSKRLRSKRGSGQDGSSAAPVSPSSSGSPRLPDNQISFTPFPPQFQHSLKASDIENAALEENIG
ncbi:prostaglandin D2 receptor 2-like [Diretmus argenteus]